jgi:hypothetical protein
MAGRERSQIPLYLTAQQMLSRAGLASRARNLGVIVDRLVGRYSELLDIRIPAFARMRFSLNLSDAKSFGKNLRH